MKRTTKKQPLHEIKLGMIIARIWTKGTRSGRRTSVTVCRRYLNGDSWKESAQFGRDDLPLVAKVLHAAHSWIYANDRVEGD